MSSDSEDEALDDLEFEEASEAENEIDEDILGALEEDLAAEVSEVEEVSSRTLFVNRIGIPCSTHPAGLRHGRL